MDLTNISVIKNILKRHDLWAKKGMGQHFLISKAVLQRIIKASDLKKTDTVLEIGPGIGTLTLELLKRVKKVIAVEKDPKMVEILKEITREYKNLEIINKDILKIAKLEIKNYKIVANIPYYITSPLLKFFLEAKNKPKFLVLMVQKEVAQRITAKPGGMSILAVSVQLYAEPEIIDFVSKDSFWPKPEVDSAIMKITVNSKQLTVKEVNKKNFFRLVRIGFSSPRKKLANNLSAGFQISKEKTEQWLQKAGIEPSKRPQEMSLEGWFGLYKALKDGML